MSQLMSLNKRGFLLVLVGVVAITLILAYVTPNRIITGHPVSSSDTAVNLMNNLRQNVDEARTTEQVYIAFWSEVCDATRKLDGQYDYDIAMIDQLSRYEELSVDYYFQIVDDGKLPEVAAYIDGARFIGGKDSCDFLPVPPEITSS